jgi:hypothetical protein
MPGAPLKPQLLVTYGQSGDFAHPCDVPVVSSLVVQRMNDAITCSSQITITGSWWALNTHWRAREVGPDLYAEFDRDAGTIGSRIHRLWSRPATTLWRYNV